MLDKKKTIIVDLDLTVLNSDITMADHYNNFMFEHEDFIPADGEKIYYYNARDEMPLYNTKDVVNIFDSQFFWDNVTVKDGVKKYLRKLKDDGRFNIVFWSFGTPRNISKKSLYVEKNLNGLYDDFIYTSGDMIKKSKHNNDCIIIDDHQMNLVNDKAFNICFADRGDRDWNIEFKGIRVKSWEDVYLVIMRYMEFVE